MQPLQYLLTVAGQVLILFLMIAAGAALTRLKMLDKIGAKQFANLMFYIVTPAVIIKAFSGVPFTPQNAKYLIIAAAVALGSLFLFILISTLVFRKSEARKKAILISSVVFSNAGFMALPMAEALFGEKGVFLVSIYVVVFNLMVWTYGVWVFERQAKLNFFHMILNPGVIGMILGLPIFLFRLQLPAIANTVVQGFAALNTPLAMVVIGIYVATASLKLQKGDGAVLVSLILRQLILPLATLGILLLLRVPADVVMACMIPICAPPAANTVIFAAKFGGDVEFASRIMPIGTLFSIITMPLILTIAKLFVH